MKELQPNVLNDYEHRVLALIARHEGEAGFPRPEDYGLEKKAVDDYLYDYQIVLDREGSQRSQLTGYGIVAIVPTVVLSAYPEQMLPWGQWSLMVGVGMGVLLAAAIKAVRMTVTRAKLAGLKRSCSAAAQYVAAVEQYENNINQPGV